MNKKSEIKKILLEMAASKGMKTLTDAKIESLAELLSSLSTTTSIFVKSKINLDEFTVKEAIDFSDTDYWINQIVDIINKK